jgi:hypothetical protein
MLSWATTRVRFRLGLTLALVYALCVVAPPLALAFSDGTVAAHCLTEDHGFLHSPALHVHERTHVHSHAAGDTHTGAAVPATHDETKHHSGTCCGLFCHAVATNNENNLTGERISHSVALPVLIDHLAGRGPDRLDRPPRAL